MSELNVVEPRELTSVERRVLNNVSMEQNANVKLGEIISEILDNVQPGTPVNAADATAVLELSGTVEHGETLRVNDTDIFEFTARQDGQAWGAHFPVPIFSKTTRATGTLTLAAQPTAGDKIKIGKKTYTFVPIFTDTADGEVSIGEDLADAQYYLSNAINGDGLSEPNESVTMSEFVENVATITAIVGGAIGNSIETTGTFTSPANLFGGATLELGVSCPAADAIAALVTAVNNNGTFGVSAIAGTGEDAGTITLSAGGSAGNGLELYSDMVNGTFSSEDTMMLTGGADGTISNSIQLMVDEDYLYVCTAPNTIAGKNWRRISLGAAY